MAFRSREPERSGNVSAASARSRAQTNANQLLRRALVQNTRLRALSLGDPTPSSVNGPGETAQVLLGSPVGDPPGTTTPRQQTPATAPALPRGADYLPVNTNPRTDGHNGTVTVWATASGLPAPATGAIGHTNLQPSHRARAQTQNTPRSPLPELRSRVSSALREQFEVNPPPTPSSVRVVDLPFTGHHTPFTPGPAYGATIASPAIERHSGPTFRAPPGTPPPIQRVRRRAGRRGTITIVQYEICEENKENLNREGQQLLQDRFDDHIVRHQPIISENWGDEDPTRSRDLRVLSAVGRGGVSATPEDSVQEPSLSLVVAVREEVLAATRTRATVDARMLVRSSDDERRREGVLWATARADGMAVREPFDAPPFDDTLELDIGNPPRRATGRG